MEYEIDLRIAGDGIVGIEETERIIRAGGKRDAQTVEPAHRQRARPTDRGLVAVRTEAVPEGAARRKALGQNLDRVIAVRPGRHLAGQDDGLEGAVCGQFPINLDRRRRARNPRPQDDAPAVGIAACHAVAERLVAGLREQRRGERRDDGKPGHAGQRGPARNRSEKRNVRGHGAVSFSLGEEASGGRRAGGPLPPCLRRSGRAQNPALIVAKNWRGAATSRVWRSPLLPVPAELIVPMYSSSNRLLTFICTSRFSLKR